MVVCDLSCRISFFWTLIVGGELQFRGIRSIGSPSRIGRGWRWQRATTGRSPLAMEDSKSSRERFGAGWSWAIRVKVPSALQSRNLVVMFLLNLRDYELLEHASRVW